MLTVSIPFHHKTPPEMLRRAVDSVLNQTFSELTLVVVNDGDPPTTAWGALADIDDPRLIRFDLPVNRGRYWADVVVTEAIDTEWWSPHDSDDESVPDRFEKLLAVAQGHDAAFSATIYHRRDGSLMHDDIRYYRAKQRLGTVARYPAGVMRTETIRGIKIDPTIRLSHDTAIVHLLFAKYRVATIDEYLYHVYKREGSLTTSPESKQGGGMRSRHQSLRRQWWSQRMNGKRFLRFPPELDVDVKRLREVL